MPKSLAILLAVIILGGLYFLTRSPLKRAHVAVAAGDIASCEWDSDEATAQLVAEIKGTVLALGDNVYPEATETNLQNCYGPSWGRFKQRTRPTLGAHDNVPHGASGDITPSLRYFGKNVGDRPDGVYSYNIGSWHVVVLNAPKCESGGCGTGSDQHNWLLEDLKKHPTQCTLAYWHDPRFGSGTAHPSNDMTSEFWRTLYQGGAEVVLSAHDHTYERIAPLNPDGQIDTERGIRSFVVGTGGAPLTGFGKPITGSEVRENTTFGVLKLTLLPDRYDWEFIPVAGKTFRDSGSDTCH